MSKPDGRTSLALTFVIVASLSFGGLSHSLLPHQHSNGETSVSSAAHSALRHEDKKSSPTPPFVFVVIALFAAGSVLLSQRIINLRSAVIRAGSSDMESLRRGIAMYRRFG